LKGAYVHAVSMEESTPFFNKVVSFRFSIQELLRYNVQTREEAAVNLLCDELETCTAENFSLRNE
jgi:hypothetical protein